MILHSFFRSSAAWRVRIALALKGVTADVVPHNFRLGEQRGADYLALNPQGLVPALDTGDAVLSQSLAIMEYLDEVHPLPPLLPPAPLDRARVRAMAQLIACDIHPINNLRVLDALRREFAADDGAVAAWCRRWIDAGFTALEQTIGDGACCFGDTVTLADVCLVPQMYNARRFAVDVAAYPRLAAIDARLAALPAFADTAPGRQSDAV